MSVQYNGKYLIPAPHISIQKEYIRGGSTQGIGVNYTITLNGKLSALQGSPNSSGQFSTDGTDFYENNTGNYFGNLLAKTSGIRSLFSDSHKPFVIQACNGAYISGDPIVRNVQFQEGQWFNYVDYSVGLEASYLNGLEDNHTSGNFTDKSGNPLYLSDASEDWNFETQDEQPENYFIPKTYRLTHTLNAAGRDTVNGTGYAHARIWALERTGVFNEIVHSGALSLPSYYNAVNRVVAENMDKINGKYSVTESWLVTSGNVIDTFTVATTVSKEDPTYKVQIDGEIKGLATAVSGKWDNASAKYDALNAGTVTEIYNRALTYSHLTYLHQLPMSVMVTRNVPFGIVTYSHAYNDRLSGCITNSLYENYTINGDYPTDVFVSVSVPGRALGPVLQPMNTFTERKRSLAVEVVVPPYTGQCPSTSGGALFLMTQSPKSNVDVVVNAMQSSLSGQYSQVFRTQDTDSWVPHNGRYTRNVGWTFQNC
jgi:hypothetical protein